MMTTAGLTEVAFKEIVQDLNIEIEAMKKTNWGNAGNRTSE